MKYLEEKKFSLNPLGKLLIDGDVVHFVVGLVEEFYELKKSITDDGLEKDSCNVNKINEIGDMYWYLSSLLTHLNDEFDPDVVPNHTIPNWMYDMSQIEKEVLQIVRYFKKYVAYGDEFRTVEISNCCKRIVAYLHDCCKCLDVTPHEVMRKNLYKLKLRFGESFEGNKAINKDGVRELTFIKKIKVKKHARGRPSLKEIQQIKAFAAGEEIPDKGTYPEKRKRRRKKRGIKPGLGIKNYLPKRRVGRPSNKERYQKQLDIKKAKKKVERVKAKRDEEERKKTDQS